MRIDRATVRRHTAGMDEFDEWLMAEAERLALAAFGPCAELEHVVAVYQCLVARHAAGLPTDGAATVH